MLLTCYSPYRRFGLTVNLTLAMIYRILTTYDNTDRSKLQPLLYHLLKYVFHDAVSLNMSLFKCCLTEQ